jgi:hypothetical protein
MRSMLGTYINNVSQVDDSWAIQGLQGHGHGDTVTSDLKQT